MATASIHYMKQMEVEIRKAINRLGNQYGCHSCGIKKAGTKKGNFILDHMPPNSLAGKRKQRLYPQCNSCSRKQGGRLSTISKKRKVYYREDKNHETANS
ncbi:hypothetical protein [Bacillus sp. NPDC094077]|uniref:hypothetical protein n=1 Tax=Bacillus sp. NPDC094077 TaxID=3390932 RepID=UPI003D026827